MIGDYEQYIAWNALLELVKGINISSKLDVNVKVWWKTVLSHFVHINIIYIILTNINLFDIIQTFKYIYVR